MDALGRTFKWVVLICGVSSNYTLKHEEQSHYPMLNYYPGLLLLLQLLIATLALLQIRLDTNYAISSSVATIVFVTQTASHVIVMLEAMLKRQQHADFLGALDAVRELLLLRLRYRVPRVALQCRVRIKYFALALLLLCALFFIIGGIVLQHDAWYFCYGLLSILTMRVRLLQLCFYVDMLVAQLHALNVKMQQLVARKCDADARQLLDFDNVPLNRVDYLQSALLVYAQLYDACTLLNDFAGWSLFSLVACYFLDFTCNVYWTVLTLDYQLPQSTFLKSGAYVVSLGIMVIVLCRSCNNCKEQGVLFNKLLIKLINTKNPAESVYQALLFEYALQLRHQCTAITAKGIFTIDTKLLMAICVSISTYLIILIQFFKTQLVKP